MAAEELSKSQVDRLGERLRESAPSDEDLVLLDGFRRSYSDAYEAVIAVIRTQLFLEPTGRPAKSTRSIIEKLRRESIRLSQMQDIAGCRFIVPDMVAQNEAVATLRDSGDLVHIDDRRSKPSHGYRAVHVIVSSFGKPIEVQVRTMLQHTWAELSEKYSDVVDPGIKYGSGPEGVRTILTQSSALVAALEQVELEPGGTNQEVVDVTRQSLRRIMQAEIDNLRDSRGSGR